MPNTLTIEIAGPANENVMFKPCKRLLRGRWEWKRAGRSPRPIMGAEQVAALPSVPGEHITLDVDARMVRIWDPLTGPGGQQITDAWKDTLKQPFVIAKELVRRNMSDNELATWAYWMRRYVEQGCAVVVEDSLKRDPKGDATLDFSMTDHFGPKTAAEMQQWREGRWTGRRGRGPADRERQGAVSVADAAG